MTYIIWPEEAEKYQEQLGGKASALAALTRAGFCIPPWFLISRQALYDSLSPSQLAELARTGSRRPASDLFCAITLNPQVKTELVAALAEAGIEMTYKQVSECAGVLCYDRR